MVERGRHPGPAVQVLPARARDHHQLAEERALGADFLVDDAQFFGGLCVSLTRSQRIEPPGLQVVFGDAVAELVT